jgi:hypothetical protein
LNEFERRMLMENVTLPGGPMSGLVASAVEYMVDAGQRSVLFLDIMRRRGDQYREHVARKRRRTFLQLLSAVETVTSKIPSTIEAAALCKMADRGQITGGVLDGPLAFDNAIDVDAARIRLLWGSGRRWATFSAVRTIDSDQAVPHQGGHGRCPERNCPGSFRGGER